MRAPCRRWCGPLPPPWDSAAGTTVRVRRAMSAAATVRGHGSEKLPTRSGGLRGRGGFALCCVEGGRGQQQWRPAACGGLGQHLQRPCAAVVAADDDLGSLRLSAVLKLTDGRGHKRLRTAVVCGKFDTGNRSGSVAGAVADGGGADTGRRLVYPSAGHGWPAAPSIFSSALPAWSH